jgi:hypothetical protein
VPLEIRQLVAVLAGAIFLYAASFKWLDPRPLAGTLRSLGAPDRVAATLGRLAPLLEVAVGFTLLGLGDSAGRFGALLLALAGLAVGGAGIIAIRKKEPIACSCFSAYASRPMGPRQVLSALGFLTCAAILFVSNPRFSQTEALVALSLAALGGGAAHAISSVRVALDLVGYRRAASITYPA